MGFHMLRYHVSSPRDVIWALSSECRPAVGRLYLWVPEPSSHLRLLHRQLCQPGMRQGDCEPQAPLIQLQSLWLEL